MHHRRLLSIVTGACACALMLLLAPASVRAAPRSNQEKAALASFQTMLAGLGRRDKAAMMAQLLPGGSATLMRHGKPVQMSFEALTERLSQPGPERHEERIHDALVRVDGDVAIIWAPFEFLIDGKTDHCGRDIVTLVLVDGRWLVAYIEDSGHNECAQKS